MAKIMRSTLVDIFREAIAERPPQNHSTTATHPSKTEVKRSRLTLEEYIAIRNVINTEETWLPVAIVLALVTAQRVGDICKLKWADIHHDRLRVTQQKIEVKLAIPFSPGLKEANVTAEEVLHMNRKICSGEKFNRISPQPVTYTCYCIVMFHEISILAARLYARQVSDNFAQHLPGHKSDSMTARDRESKEWDLIDVE